MLNEPYGMSSIDAEVPRGVARGDAVVRERAGVLGSLPCTELLCLPCAWRTTLSLAEDGEPARAAARGDDAVCMPAQDEREGYAHNPWFVPCNILSASPTNGDRSDVAVAMNRSVGARPQMGQGLTLTTLLQP